MSTDRVVRWQIRADVPDHESLEQVLQDFIGASGTVEWRIDRWFVTLPTALSFALRRQTQTMWDWEGGTRERGFEVWPSVDLLVVSIMTREQDEFTSALANGVAKLVARWWVGKIDPQ